MDGLTSFYFRAEVVGKLKKEVVAGTKEEEGSCCSENSGYSGN